MGLYQGIGLHMATCSYRQHIFKSRFVEQIKDERPHRSETRRASRDAMLEDRAGPVIIPVKQYMAKTLQAKKPEARYRAQLMSHLDCALAHTDLAPQEAFRVGGWPYQPRGRHARRSQAVC